MFLRSNNQLKKYIKISNNSGCVSANYNITNEDIIVSLIEEDGNEVSGQFNISKIKK